MIMIPSNAQGIIKYKLSILLIQSTFFFFKNGLINNLPNTPTQGITVDNLFSRN